MNDRDFKKWRPFNSVIPSRELLKRDEIIDIPNLSKDEIYEFEEKLKTSFYLKLPVEISYIENSKMNTIKDVVTKLDPLKKNIYTKNKIINFRQIFKVK